MMGHKKAVKPMLILGLLGALSKPLGADYRLPGATSMRKLLFLGLLSLGVATFTYVPWQAVGGTPSL